MQLGLLTDAVPSIHPSIHPSIYLDTSQASKMPKQLAVGLAKVFHVIYDKAPII
jgi:hypothetical protein